MSAPTPTTSFNDRFIRRRELIQITSLPSSTITDLIKQGRFPKPYRITTRSSAWKESEIKAWMDACPQTQAGGAA
ncbi:MAG: AlpA family phage regulatory protein [Thiolinea sp.]